jgi:proteasome accessory factor B
LSARIDIRCYTAFIDGMGDKCVAARHTNRSERLLVIEQMLARSATGLRAVELAAACDVDRRTVYRDLALLNELGVPIFQKDGRFFINRDAYRAPLRLSCDEAMLLLLAASALSTYPSVNTTSLTNAIANLSQIVPEAAAVHAGYLGSVVTREQEPHHVILDRLIRAWAEQRRVQIEYTSRDGTKRRLTEMAVYFIEPRASGSLYAVGYDMVSARIRALKLRRITRVDVLVTTYQTPSHFDPRPYLRRMRQRRDRAESA